MGSFVVVHKSLDGGPSSNIFKLSFPDPTVVGTLLDPAACAVYSMEFIAINPESQCCLWR